ncbi:MAG: TfoX family protein [Curvibacter sp.]|nr:MAG: TfoX family protein [Curvibacter sp.]
MGTRQSTIDHLLDQLTAAGPVSVRKMFGEYCLYLAGKPVGLVCDDQLFLKPTEAARPLLKSADEKPPYPGGKPYFHIDPDHWDEREWLVDLVRTTAQALPEPVPRPSRARSA